MPFSKFRRKPIGVLAIVAGSICVLASVGWAIHSYWLTSTALRATGRITQLIERHGNDGDAYYPVFVYPDRNGVQHTIYSSAGSYPPPHQAGDSVTVLYDAGAENNAQLDDWFTLWGVPIILAANGIVYLPVGIVICAWPWITGRAKQLAASP